MATTDRQVEQQYTPIASTGPTGPTGADLARSWQVMA